MCVCVCVCVCVCTQTTNEKNERRLKYKNVSGLWIQNFCIEPIGLL
jgi:hypothetical protein